MWGDFIPLFGLAAYFSAQPQDSVSAPTKKSGFMFHNYNNLSFKNFTMYTAFTRYHVGLELYFCHDLLHPTGK